MTTDTAIATKPGNGQAAASEFRLLPLAQLREAPYNPRKTFDEETLKELVESVKAKGVITPLLVRGPLVFGHGDFYEIVGGARRYRAAKKAGLAEVPVQIRQLSDDEALEVCILDNLQRADVSPLEEAHGYQVWLDRGHKPEDLAKKIGKSLRYVYARLELRKLSPKVQEALGKGDITPSHAQIIARLAKPADQETALHEAGIAKWRAVDQIVPSKEDDRQVKGTLSVRDLERIVTGLKVGAEFLAQRDELAAKLKASGGKTAVYLVCDGYSNSRQVLSEHSWKPVGATRCEHVAKGIAVNGKRRGQVLDVCAASDKCAKHWKLYRPAVEKPPSPAEVAKRKAAVLKEKTDRLTAKRVLLRMLEVGPATLTRQELAEVVWVLNDNGPDILDEKYVWLGSYDRRKIEKNAAALKEAELVRLVRACLWNDEANYGAGKEFWERAKELGVDIAGERAAAERELAPKLIAWTVKGKKGTGKGAKGRVYELIKKGHGWWWERPGSGVGCGGSGAFDTLEEAQASVEAVEKEMLGYK